MRQHSQSGFPRHGRDPGLARPGKIVESRGVGGSGWPRRGPPRSSPAERSRLRWPARVRSGEGHPLALLRARLSDWGDDGLLLAISSPVHPTDSIALLYRDGDRRRMEYLCPACDRRTPFGWEQVVGRDRGEQPMIACLHCGTLHDERARRRMLRSGIWVPQKSEPTDEGSISFQLGRLDSARASLGAIVQEFRRASRGAERGDPRALATFRNTVLGLPGESGGADVDRLYERRGSSGQLAIEQVTAGVDVQNDRLVYVVLGFTAQNAIVQVVHFGVVVGDPRDGAVWDTLTAEIDTHRAPLPVSVISVDAGFLTSTVKAQCARRRWWVPTIGRAGTGQPIARVIGTSGLAVLGKDDSASWWTGRIDADRVHLPRTINRKEIGELLAAEALTAEGGGAPLATDRRSSEPHLGRSAPRRPCAPLPTVDSRSASLPGRGCVAGRSDRHHRDLDLIGAGLGNFGHGPHRRRVSDLGALLQLWRAVQAERKPPNRLLVAE